MAESSGGDQHHPARRAQQLADLVAAVASCADESAATQRAAEAVAGMVGATAAAFVRGGRILSATGFSEVPSLAIFDVCSARRTSVPLDDDADAPAVTVTIEELPPTRLLVARPARAFDDHEMFLLRAVARVLSLTLRSVRAIERERALRERSQDQARENGKQLAELLERHAVLERLGRIQRAISRASELREVLDAVADGARELVGDEVAIVRLIDPDEPDTTVLLASVGIGTEVASRALRVPVARGIAGRAITENTLVVADDEHGPVADVPDVPVAAAVPLHERGAVVGALVVGSRRAGRAYSPVEREALVSLAEHASTAIAAARAAQASLRQAMHDDLTGLPNRMLFVDRLRHAVESSRRSSRGVGVLCVDIDRFKIVNDSFGDGVGDEVLVEVGARLRSCLRGGDTASRLGGDEFALLVEGVARVADLEPVAERVMHVLRMPFSVGGRDVSLGASIGIAFYRDGETAEEVMRNATLAMHEAKARGRARIEIFEPSMHARLVERVELQADLQRALTNNELELHYQPIVALEDERLTGFEALVRWRHPVRGLLAPAEFIPLAEDVGLIVPIGRWVLARACEDLRVFDDVTDERLSMSVNLSARDFEDARLAEGVRRALERHAIDASRLVVEITESSLIETHAMMDTLSSLKQLGVRIAIDDFGTGYSSLSYLRRFPVDILKVDRSFVDGIGRGEDASALARAIVKLGQVLGLRTVAEGVEEAPQRDVLRALGCEAAQGELFSPPLCARDVVEMLSGRADGRKRLRSVG